MFYIVFGMVVALLAGIYIGLGWPGLPVGRDDRAVRPGQARRTLRRKRIDWLRSKERTSQRR